MPESKKDGPREAHTAESVKQLSGEVLLDTYDSLVRESNQLLPELFGDEVQGKVEHPKYQEWRQIGRNIRVLRTELALRLRDQTVH
ncbi:MAG TPA: hypothetical protein VGB97_03390 [Candidatus Paceibacterota bacterium]|jgi:hypothetical protein